jgi:predicted metal-dependent peptidase
MNYTDKLAKARIALMQQSVFFRALILRLGVQEMAGLDTMATDGKNIFYARSFVEEQPIEFLTGTLAHEILHCALLHFARMNGRDADLWNQATDYAINREVLEHGFKLPDWVLKDSRFDGMSAEAIYSVLKQERDAAQKKAQQQQPGSGQPGTGQLQAGNQSSPQQPGGQRVIGEVRKPEGKADATGRAEADKLAQEWQQATAIARGVARKAGKHVPESVTETLSGDAEPAMPWQQELAEFFTSRHVSELDYRRANRRHLSQGLWLPRSRPAGIRKAVLVLDTSGSVNEQLGDKMLSETEAVLELGLIKSLVVIQTDTKVRHVQELELGDTASRDFIGRGGTDFTAAMAFIAENHSDADAIVFLSDMDTREFGTDPEVPVLWVAYGSERYQKQPPYGRVIQAVE